jgi:hypothetical protein
MREGMRALVPPAGLEPTTVRLEGGCSIQLSYRGACAKLYEPMMAYHPRAWARDMVRIGNCDEELLHVTYPDHASSW